MVRSKSNPIRSLCKDGELEIKFEAAIKHLKRNEDNEEDGEGSEPMEEEGNSNEATDAAEKLKKGNRFQKERLMKLKEDSMDGNDCDSVAEEDSLMSEDGDKKPKKVGVGGYQAEEKYRHPLEDRKEMVAMTDLQKLITEGILRSNGCCSTEEITNFVSKRWKTLKRRDGTPYATDCRRAILANLRVNPNCPNLFRKDPETEGWKVCQTMEEALSAMMEKGVIPAKKGKLGAYSTGLFGGVKTGKIEELEEEIQSGINSNATENDRKNDIETLDQANEIDSAETNLSDIGEKNRKRKIEDSASTANSDASDATLKRKRSSNTAFPANNNTTNNTSPNNSSNGSNNNDSNTSNNNNNNSSNNANTVVENNGDNNTNQINSPNQKPVKKRRTKGMLDNGVGVGVGEESEIQRNTKTEDKIVNADVNNSGNSAEESNNGVSPPKRRKKPKNSGVTGATEGTVAVPAKRGPKPHASHNTAPAAPVKENPKLDDADAKSIEDVIVETIRHQGGQCHYDIIRGAVIQSLKGSVTADEEKDLHRKISAALQNPMFSRVGKKVGWFQLKDNVGGAAKPISSPTHSAKNDTNGNSNNNAVSTDEFLDGEDLLFDRSDMNFDEFGDKDEKALRKDPEELTDLQILIVEAIGLHGESATLEDIITEVAKRWGGLRRRDGSKYAANCSRAVMSSLANNPQNRPIFKRIPGNPVKWGLVRRGLDYLAKKQDPSSSIKSPNSPSNELSFAPSSADSNKPINNNNNNNNNNYNTTTNNNASNNNSNTTPGSTNNNNNSNSYSNNSISNGNNGNIGVSIPSPSNANILSMSTSTENNLNCSVLSDSELVQSR